ncbi:MAG TPA: universal stress protein [bacterium]|nr:universal stress protein [bacterium]
MQKEDEILAGGGDPPVFRRAIVAVALSPSIQAVLNQSQRILKILGARPVLLHVGQDTPAARAKLQKAIAASRFAELAPELIIQPGQPAEAIAAAAYQQRADLIITGAARKESLLRHFIGSVAPHLARQTPCSLLMMAGASDDRSSFTRIHCEVEYDRPAHFAIEAAMGIARRMHSRELVLTHSFQVEEWEGKGKTAPVNGEIRRVYHHQDIRLKRFLTRYPANGLRLRTQCIHELSLASTLDFARDIAADLMVIPGPRRQSGIWDRLFGENLEQLFKSLSGAILLTRRTRYRPRG